MKVGGAASDAEQAIAISWLLHVDRRGGPKDSKRSDAVGLWERGELGWIRCELGA